MDNFFFLFIPAWVAKFVRSEIIFGLNNWASNLPDQIDRPIHDEILAFWLIIWLLRTYMTTHLFFSRIFRFHWWYIWIVCILYVCVRPRMCEIEIFTTFKPHLYGFHLCCVCIHWLRYFYICKDKYNNKIKCLSLYQNSH